MNTRASGEQRSPRTVKGFYELIEQQPVPPFREDLQECWWLGRRGEHSVLVCEIDGRNAMSPALIQEATKRFTSSNQRSHVAKLLATFPEDGHHFFVFELPGESLPTYMQRVGGTLNLQNALAGCRQLLQLLYWMSIQQPVVVHGSIRPEYVRVASQGRWVLTHFSPEILAGVPPASLRSSSSTQYQQSLPDWGAIGSAQDLSAAMATILFTLTGQPPHNIGAQIEQVALMYPDVASTLKTLFSQALHLEPTKRSVRPEELLALISPMSKEPQQKEHPHHEAVSGIMQEGKSRLAGQLALPAQHMHASAALVPPAPEIRVMDVTPPRPAERKGTLPHPDTLPPIPPPPRFDAYFWIWTILTLFGCLFLLSS
ncbi:hypothetical protein KSF_106270 [Reticulibacter mediterranei]|uniref:Protein kinase domain-containing protein n=1 Tax=Reticulibacter mediterranei TaxID=2778369 RepID=A0A8J3IZ32_9CHLR|nr:hypothetical protein [Reticulibacter mediterranei]GHP00580.1 hypothetical protein KSF_106270 [Reticulibacter mediterranei]